MNRPRHIHGINILQLNMIALLIVFILLPFAAKPYGAEEDAARFFRKKQYIQALPIYKEYSRLYPGNPIYAYYYGICLSETGQLGNETRKILLNVALEDVPVDVLFYVGKNYHFLNDFETALIYYYQFREMSKKKEQRAVKLRKVLKQCEAYINPYTLDTLPETATPKKDNQPEKKNEETLPVPEPLLPETYKDSSAVTSVPEPADTLAENQFLKTPENTRNEMEDSFPEEIPQALKDTFIYFVLTTEIYYQKIHQFRNSTAKDHFVKAWQNNREMDQIVAETVRLRKIYDQTESTAFKKEIAHSVIALEQKQLSLKTAIESNYLKARALELEFWNSATADDFQMLNAEKELYATLRQPAIKEISDDTVQTVQDTGTIQTVAPDEQKTVEPFPSVIAVESEKEEIIPAKEPSGVIFKIQIGAHTNEPPESVKQMYQKLSLLRKIDHFTDDRGITLYTIGETANFNDAKKLQEQIRMESVKDAFIIAFKNGKRITLKEALENTKR